MSIKEQIVKLQILESRIKRWRDVGPACTEREWDNMEKDLQVVVNFIAALKRRPDHPLKRSHVKLLNAMWHLYSTKQGQSLDALMGGINWSQIASKIGE